jgi:hypothetical protein
MPALIDNYTAIECVTETHPKLINVRYITEVHRPISSSTIVSIYAETGINQRIIKLLDDYKQLNDNWDADGAMAPSRSAINLALFLTRTLEKHGQSMFHAAPGPHGEIMLDIRNSKNTKSLEIIFYADRAVSVLFPEDGKPTQQSFDFHNLPHLLQCLNQK